MSSSGASTAEGPLRVVYTISSAAPNRLLDCLLEHVDPAEVRLSVVVLDAGVGPYADALRARGVDVTGLGAPSTRQLPVAAFRLRRVLARLRPDVVHANLIWPSALTEVVRRTLRPRPASVVARHHNRNHHLQAKRWHVLVDRWTASAADRVLAVSPAVRTTLVDVEGVPAGQVVVVENGLDWNQVIADPANVQRWKDRFAGRRLLVAAGRLDFQKDYPTLLVAVARAVVEHPDLLLAVAFQNGDDPRAVALAELVEHLGLVDHVALLGPVVDMYDLMAAADAFVQASVDESFGQTLLEAMALGVPLVATAPGGAADVVGPWYPVIAVGDDQALAAGMAAVLADPAGARNRAAAIAPEVRRRYGAERMARETVDLYRAVSRPT